jgi:hypothetical protein
LSCYARLSVRSSIKPPSQILQRWKGGDSMINRPYPLRIPEGVLQLAEMRGQEERTDKTTTLRQWLYAAAEEYAFKRLAEGRLTLAQTAELLDMSVYDVQHKAREYGLELGATAEQYSHALETARQLRSQRNASATP